jgi:hypothetical protein
VFFDIRLSSQKYVIYDNQLISEERYKAIKKREEILEQQRLAEEQRKERLLEQQRLIEEKRREVERVAEEKRREEARIAEEKRREEARIAEEKRKQNAISVFMAERETKVYSVPESEKISNEDKIVNVIEKLMENENGKNISFTVTDQCRVDYNGTVHHNVNISGLINPATEAALKQNIEYLTLTPVQATEPYTKNQYPVHSEAVYKINTTIENKIFKVKKSNVATTIPGSYDYIYRSQIDKLISSGPMGKYKIQIQKNEINGKDYSSGSVLKYRGTGGPANMFLSVLIAGLGVKPVTGGTKSGLGRTIPTYAFLAAGAGCKFASNNAYKKYHAATDQTEMDKHYKTANTLNQVFYGCVAVGGAIWLYDIIWVAAKGSKNKKQQQAYKNRHFSLYYQPEFEATGLTYQIKF